MIYRTWTITAIIVSALLGACSHFQTREAAYLDSVKGRGTQTEVRTALGDPKAIRPSEGGESVWVYEVMEQQSGNRFTAPGIWCEQYLLTFDDKTVLQRWRQLSHFHGGELMPKECIPGAGSPQS
jgi:outer membrane protein assembly factor BamE (lipoprotein component of BamABCDE complex)